jgi:hypothetical protein
VTDPLLTTALIVATGLAVGFYVKWRRAETRAALYALPLKDLANWELIDAISRGEDAQAEFNKRIESELHKQRMAQWGTKTETRGGDGLAEGGQ